MALNSEALSFPCKTVIVERDNRYHDFYVRGEFEVYGEYTDTTWEPIYLAVSRDVEVWDKEGVHYDYNELSEDIIHEIEEDVLNRSYEIA